MKRSCSLLGLWTVFTVILGPSSWVTVRDIVSIHPTIHKKLNQQYGLFSSNKKLLNLLKLFAAALYEAE